MKHPFNRAFAQKKSTAQNTSAATSKYHNTKVEYQGITFDSKKEYQRYLFLKDLEAKGIISNLQIHKTYELIPKQTYRTTEVKHLKTKDKIIEKERCIFLSVKFSPDFVYTYKGHTMAEDVKGSNFLMSKDFPIRQKLLYHIHHILCTKVTNPTAPIFEPLNQ